MSVHMTPATELLDVREQFPILANNSDVIYLDSAATAQKPQSVLDAVNAYLVSSNANAGRGTYAWANATTNVVDAAKERVKSFLMDPDPGRSTVELVSGTTEGLHRIALDWLVEHLADGDEVVIPVRDHQANTTPWLLALEHLTRRGIGVIAHEMPYDHSGDYDLEALRALVGPRLRFVAATHVHHVYGMNMGIERVRAAIGQDPVLCVDSAQAVGHLPFSVDEIGADFVVFSGHKAMALPGTGAVWARNRIGKPFARRGWDGTPNTVGAVSLTAALDWLDGVGIDIIEAHLRALTGRLEAALTEIDGITLMGCESGCRLGPTPYQRVGIVAFRHQHIRSGELGFVLDTHGFMVRSNTHCQAGATEEDGSVRVSMHAYTTAEDVERFIQTTKEITR